MVPPLKNNPLRRCPCFLCCFDKKIHMFFDRFFNGLLIPIDQGLIDLSMVPNRRFRMVSTSLLDKSDRRQKIMHITHDMIENDIMRGFYTGNMKKNILPLY